MTENTLREKIVEECFQAALLDDGSREDSAKRADRILALIAERGPVMPETPSDAAIEAQCDDEWIGHPEAKQESVDRWRKSQRVAARARYQIIRAALLDEQKGWPTKTAKS